MITTEDIQDKIDAFEQSDDVHYLSLAEYLAPKLTLIAEQRAKTQAAAFNALLEAAIAQKLLSHQHGTFSGPFNRAIKAAQEATP
jgi:hypothetical protein